MIPQRVFTCVFTAFHAVGNILATYESYSVHDFERFRVYPDKELYLWLVSPVPL